MSMKFTQPCFVRVDDIKEQEALVKWAKSIGYNCKNHTDGDVNPLTVCSGSGYCFSALEFDGSYDCGTNIPLFKALAAMNDTNKLHQWHISSCFILFKKLRGLVETETGRRSVNAGEWFKPLDRGLKFSFLGHFVWQEATKEDIIEHFITVKP